MMNVAIERINMKLILMFVMVKVIILLIIQAIREEQVKENEVNTSLFELETGYKLFEGQDCVDDFLAKTDNFHDCCCHEIRLLYDACVFSDGVMLDNTGLHIKLLFHSQDKNYPAFEIIFADVQKFTIGEKYLGASYSYSMGFESSYFFIRGNPESLHIESNEACYKILPLYSLS